MFYRKYMAPTLEAAVSEMLECTPDEQINLYEELALVRTMAAEAVTLYSAAIESKRDELKEAATIMMRDALNEVRIMCATAAQVEGSRKDNVSPRELKHIVSQLIRIMHVVCGEENIDIARRFEEAVSTELKILTDASGTDLDPTQEVREMISTIPVEEGIEE